MPTDHPGDQALARSKQLRSQRQAPQNTFQNTASYVNGYQMQTHTPESNVPHPDIFQTQPLSTALTVQGFSFAGVEDVWQRSTIPMKVAETPVPTEFSPLESVAFLPEQMFHGIPPVQAMPAIPQAQSDGISIVIVTWFYRLWLICATILLVSLLLWLQDLLDRVHIHPSIWRTIVQWAELTWLTPIPLAMILWFGWFFFAEAARPDPEHVSAPVVFPPKRGFWAFAPPRPVRLVFRFVTRGDNIDVLRDSIRAVHQAFARYQQSSGPYGIEIISECPISLNLGPDQLTRIYVVPPAYVTQHRSRFKARALTYLQEQVRPRPEDWYIYLDEESLVNEHMLAGMYSFIWRSIEEEQRAQQGGKKSQQAGLIGQGAILYQGGNWFFRGADALRTADDLGRFRLQYALGVPMFGVHGSYIVIRGIHDQQLSFDVGTANSVTEDAAWALRAWSQGFRFAWVHGYLHEQPPQKARDFVRQRSRWLSGIRAVLGDRQTPFPYRLCLGIFTVLWQFAFLPFLVAIVALFVHASPFHWIRLPADFAWATFTLAYLQGIDIQSRYPHPFLKKGIFETQWKRAVSWLLILCSLWYALLEAVGVLYSFKPKQGFFVIQKPSMAAENEKVKRPRPNQ